MNEQNRRREVLIEMTGFALGAWVITAIAAVGLGVSLAIAAVFLLSGIGLLTARVWYDNRWLDAGKGVAALGGILFVLVIYPPSFDLILIGPALTGVAGIVVLVSWKWGSRFAHYRDSTE